MHDEAPKGRRLVTNQNYLLGNHHLLVEKMTLDWNIKRIGDAKKVAHGATTPVVLRMRMSPMVGSLMLRPSTRDFTVLIYRHHITITTEMELEQI